MAGKTTKFGVYSMDFDENRKQTEKVFMGILGAMLFSLGGVLLWVLLWYAGSVAGLAGLVTLILAVNGYKILGKKLTRRGLIIAIVVTVLALIFAWMLSITIDVLQAFSEGYKAGEVKVMPTFFQAFAYGMLRVFTDKAVMGSYLMSLVIGLALAALASVFYVKPLFQKIKEADKRAEGQIVVNDPDGYVEEEPAASDVEPGYALIGAANDEASTAEAAVEAAVEAAADEAADAAEKAVNDAAAEAEQIITDTENTITQTEE